MARPHLLLHPAFAAALVVLAVNDHVAKALWPGVVTGKLSDFAGVFVVAVALGAITGRHRPALTVTALGFAALKLSPIVAAAAAPLLGGITVNDPTDLIGLLALAPAATLLAGPTNANRRSTAPADPAGRPEPSRPARSRDSFWRSSALVVTAAATTLTVTATSCLVAPSVDGLFLADGVLVAQVSTDDSVVDPAFDLYTSADGGLTWALADADTLDAVGGQDLAPDIDLGSQPSQPTEACLDDGACYRAVLGEGIVVEALSGDEALSSAEVPAGDDDWLTAFAFSDDEVRRMNLRADTCSVGDPLAATFAAVVAAPTGTPGGQTIVATLDSQGVLRLDRSTGSWERVAVGPTEPISLVGPTWLAGLRLTPLLAIVASPLVLFRRGDVTLLRRTLAALAGMAIAGGAGLVIFALWALSFGTFDYALSGIVAVVASVTALIVAVAIVVPRGSPPPAPPASPPPDLHRPTRRGG